MANIGYLMLDNRMQPVQKSSQMNSQAALVLDSSLGILAYTAPDGSVAVRFASASPFFVNHVSHASNGYFFNGGYVDNYVPTVSGRVLYLRNNSNTSLPVFVMAEMIELT